jgi:hypothetical protein
VIENLTLLRQLQGRPAGFQIAPPLCKGTRKPKVGSIISGPALSSFRAYRRVLLTAMMEQLNLRTGEIAVRADGACLQV